MTTLEKYQSFFDEYIQLCKKHNLYIEDCCCNEIIEFPADRKLYLDKVLNAYSINYETIEEGE